MWSRVNPMSITAAFMRWWSGEFLALMPERGTSSANDLPRRRLVIAPSDRCIHASLRGDDQTILFSEEVAWPLYSRDTLNRWLSRARDIAAPDHCMVSLALANSVSQTILIPQKASPKAVQIIRDEVRRKTPLKVEELFIGYHVRPVQAGKTELQYLVAPLRSLDRQMLQLHLTHTNLSLLETMPAGGERPAAVAYRTSGYRSDPFRTMALSLAGVTLSLLCFAAATLYVRQAVRISDLNETAERLASQSRQAGVRVKSLVENIDDARRLAATRQAPGAAAIWTEVTEALSDATYLTELLIDENTVRLSGFSDSVADVLSALESSPMFRRPALSGSMTRQMESRKQSFTLKASLSQVRVPDGGPD